MGNLAATSQALAGSLYNIFGDKPLAPMLSQDSIEAMEQFSPVRRIKDRTSPFTRGSNRRHLLTFMIVLRCSQNNSSLLGGPSAWNMALD